MTAPVASDFIANDGSLITVTSQLPVLAACDLSAGQVSLAAQFATLTSELRAVVAQVCSECERVQFPPMLACTSCHSRELNWGDVGGAGTVYSWVIVTGGEERVSYTIPWRLRDQLPYATVFVQPAAVAEEFRIPVLMVGPDVEVLRAGLGVTTAVNDVAERPVATAVVASAT